MCGIVALVGAGIASAERARRMSDAVRHRGPDDAGIWHAPGVALAHRRLSIIDLSAAGHQPMTSHDGRYQIVYNGEIFNYRELAARLPGVTWRGGSDTEVLLAAFERWGAACVDELAGFFAFAIWDTVERRLFIARDRLGIKPLYYARLDDGWAIASEIGALLAAGVPAEPDHQILREFLACDFYEHADATFFRGIRKLPPGHVAWVSEGRAVEPVRYWDLARDASRIEVPASASVRGEELVARLERAVRSWLRSDVQVGIALSGGLDSAVLLSLVDRAQPEHERIGAFSFDFDDPAYSERPWFERMAQHTGHRSYTRTVTPADLVDTLDRIIGQQQEPHAGAPITAYTLCFEMIRQHGVIVAMDGSGIDEALAGYDRFRPARWADLEREGKLDELAVELQAVGLNDEAGRAKAARLMAAAAARRGDVGKAQDLSSSVRPDCLGEALRGLAPEVEFERPFPDALRNLMYRELRYTKLPRALRFRDRLSMAYGTELRPPFLDHDVLAFMFALPGEDRIHRGTTKALLRDAADRLLPDTIRLASKRSVQTPQREWFRGPLAGWVREQIDQPAFWQLGWVERAPALRALDEFLAGSGDNSFFVWQWIALARWAALFL